MDFEAIKELFEANLSPMRTDIKDLKDGQKELIEIIKVQTRHDEALAQLQTEFKDCKEYRKTGSNRWWDVARLGIAGFCGAIFSKFF